MLLWSMFEMRKRTKSIKMSIQIDLIFVLRLILNNKLNSRVQHRSLTNTFCTKNWQMSLFVVASITFDWIFGVKKLL